MNGVGKLGGFWGLGLGFGSAGVGSANGGCLAMGFGAAGVGNAGADFGVEEEAEEPDEDKQEDVAHDWCLIVF